MKLSLRVFDVLFSFVGLLLLSPLFFILGILIWRGDHGPIFFRQIRIGQNGHPFTMLKFRTMHVDQNKKDLFITIKGDPRITAVGSWLRKCKLDELPQLINVLKGEMTLVGPRPEVKKYVDLYSDQQKAILKLRPGITDPASLKYYCESELLSQTQNPEQVYVQKIMPDKIQINLEYGVKKSILSDFKIIGITLLRVLGVQNDLEKSN